MPSHPRHRPVRTASLALLLIVVTVLAGCTSSSVVDGQGSARSVPAASPSGSSSSPSGSTGSSGGTQPAAQFSDCAAIGLGGVDSLPLPAARKAELRFTCAVIKVPLDYAKPDGSTVSLLLLRVHDIHDTDPAGQLLVNPGGPGGSGIELAAGLASKIPQTVIEHYDMVGFDPRGVEFSTPLRCTSNARKDVLNAASPDVLTKAGFAQAQDLAKATDEACSRKYGSALQYFNTVDTARDMDRIRQAVGDTRMNYLGFSYGTELGSVYAHLFPRTVRTMVLDGAVDPLTGDIESAQQQLGGFEGAFDQFATYCRRTKPCNTLGNPRKAVYAIQAASRRKPLAVGDRRLTFSLATTGVLSALYSRSQWPTLGSALVAARRGRGAGLLALADQYNERQAGGTYTNISDANLVIGCNDSRPGPSDALIRSTAKRWAKDYPMFGLDFAPGLFSCQQWQHDRTPPPERTADTPNKVLVIGNLHDPATPYQGAIDLARAMGNAEVLTWDGEGHTSYLQGSTCVNGYVNAYLVKGTLPPTKTTCPA